jgi:hypothetical protein
MVSDNWGPAVGAAPGGGGHGSRLSAAGGGGGVGGPLGGPDGGGVADGGGMGIIGGAESGWWPIDGDCMVTVDGCPGAAPTGPASC